MNIRKRRSARSGRAALPSPGRPPGRIAPLGHMVVVGRWGDRQHTADRLDPVGLPVILDEGDHGLNRRSSSASLPDRRMHAVAERGQNRLTPCAGSRSPAEAPGSPAPAPGSAPAPRSSTPASHPHRAQPDGPTGAASPPCCRTWPRSRPSPPIASHSRPHDPAPAVRPARIPLLNIDPVVPDSPSLHPLKSSSRRQTRRGSLGRRTDHG